jgi:hypothetical protein
MMRVIDLDQLELIADWKDDLRSRIDRARLRFELIGLGPDEQEQLEDEVQQFKRVCAYIAWSMK